MLQQSFVVLRPTVQLVDPVGRAGERDVCLRIGPLGGQVADFDQLRELLVRAEPGEATARARVARLELRFVPQHPVVDAAVVVLDGLGDEAAPVVVRVVVRQPEVSWRRPLALIGVGGRPRRRELEQTDDLDAAVSSCCSWLVPDREFQIAEVIRAFGLNLVPGQDDALPTGAEISHHLGVAEALGNPKAGIEWRRLRGAGRCRSRDEQARREECSKCR